MRNQRRNEILEFILPSSVSGHPAHSSLSSPGFHAMPGQSYRGLRTGEVPLGPPKKSVREEDSQDLALEFGRHFLKDTCLHRVGFLLPLSRQGFQGHTMEFFWAALNNKDYT